MLSKARLELVYLERRWPWAYSRDALLAGSALGSQLLGLDGGALCGHRISRPVEREGKLFPEAAMVLAAGPGHSSAPWVCLARFPRLENAEPFGGPHGAFPGYLAGARRPDSSCRFARVRLGAAVAGLNAAFGLLPVLFGEPEWKSCSVITDAARHGGGARNAFGSPVLTGIWRAVHGGGRGLRQIVRKTLQLNFQQLFTHFFVAAFSPGVSADTCAACCGAKKWRW